MTSALDRDLAARDAVLPGMATLLDEDAFAAALAAALPDAGVVAAEADYVRYKPATSCLVAYLVRTSDGARTRVYARAHRPGVEEKLRSGRRAARKGSPLGAAGAVLAEEAVAIHVFPYDRRLTALRRVARGRRTRTLRYKPERRWVGRIGDRVVRVHEESRFRPAAAAARALAAVPGLPVAGDVRVDDEARAVSTAWLPGVALDELLGRAAGVEAAAPAGVALARLHRAHVTGLAPRPGGESA
jgi:hypothetical protein